VFSGDLAPALIALGAAVTLASPRGTRNLPLRDLYSGEGDKPFRLDVDEILLHIEVPPPPAAAWSAYYKHRSRKSIDFPLASVAALFVIDPLDRICQRARVALSGVSTQPIEVEGVQELLEGKRLDGERAEEAASLAARQAKPVENLLGSSRAQRKHMVQALVSRAIRQALQSIEQPHSL
jgi:4-hydroxybenzoyl-CoA reductase subunit beta